MKYRRISHIVDAVQFQPGMTPMPDCVQYTPKGTAIVCVWDGRFRTVCAKDWIVTDNNGHHVFNPEEFAARFEPVSGDYDGTWG